jgi:mycothiol synthase
LDAAELAAVRALVAEAAAADDGQEGIDPHRLAQVAAGRADTPPGGAPGADRPGTVAVLGWADDAPGPGTGAGKGPGERRLAAYAQVVHTDRRWEAELVVAPSARDALVPLGAELLRAAFAEVARQGGGPVHLWALFATDAHGELAEAVDLKFSRDLWQMRRPLPVGEAFEIETRPFRPGEDEEAWVRVNNKAFAWHPEQSGWTVEEVRRHEAEDWFDPEGFLLHEWHGRLAGFCWTKVHADHEPPLGEIYVIAVDPTAAGLGLGRKLTLAGLDHLARKGLTVGMLYVDAENEPAVRLYERLGFTLHHVDRAFAGEVSPA